MVSSPGEAVRTVVHVSTASSWRGGERQALFLASGLEEQGFRSVAAVKAHSEMHMRCIEHDIPVEPLPFKGELDGFSMLRLSSLLRKTAASIVHAHDAHGVSFASVAGMLAGVPAVATRRVDFPLQSPWKYRRLSKLICISRAVRNICASSGLDPTDMPVVQSGIDTEWAMAADPDRKGVIEQFFPGLPVSRLLLNVASLVDHKGQVFLLEAMSAVLSRFPDSALLIAGEGELRRALEAKASLMGISGRVCFAGFRTDVARLIRSCDVFVMPSRMEGLGTSLMDAMAAGKPVVATTAGGMEELVENRVSGLQVSPCDPLSLSSALLELIENRDLSTALAAGARKRALASFSIGHMVRGTAEVYRSVLSGH
jgi:glycosyltransferase involved in cell wall biosynthesis